MNVLVTGTRNPLTELQRAYVIDHLLELLAEEGPLPDGKHRIIHGDASGVDRLAGRSAMQWVDCEVVAYPAHWKTFGRAAGAIRNQQMLDKEKVDVVLAFPSFDSKGTWDMVERAVKARIPVRVYRL